MEKITLKIDGMHCAMCESHVNDALRGVSGVKKAKSCCKTGETVVVAEAPIPDETLRRALEPLGYRLLTVTREPYEKQRRLWFGR